MFRSRKSSLSLSINAIVVLILAITILGLGLGFIKKQFGGMSDRFTQVNVEMEKELTEKIRTSGELLVFNVVSLDVTRGVENTFYMGISNTDTQTRCFTLMFECVKSLGANGCDGSMNNNIVAGGVTSAPNGISNFPAGSPFDPLWFKVFTDVDIEGSEVGIYPVTIQIGGVTPDTYLMQVVVYKSTTDCDGGGVFSEFQRKQFYIKLK